MAKSLIIVESPTKAKTIEKFLGKNYEVLASYGHVRDLPDSAAEIPEAVKKEKWARLGVNVDSNFEPLYIVPDDKKARVKELKAALKNADEVLLATDEDREGESISWHLLEVLRPSVPVKRLVFHEITKSAIEAALKATRDLDENLVRAQETRRIVDRLFGYSVSPLLWKKMAPRLSAGRVQSVALKLLVERERERVKFVSGSYWDLKAKFRKSSGEEFEAELSHINKRRVASGKDFDTETGKLAANSEAALLDAEGAEQLRKKVLAGQAKVDNVEEKPYTARPYPPFTTSTLQQEGSRKLGFAARRTMQVAQSLYENGFITYMRTDSTNLSQEALDGARSLIAAEFGSEYLHPEPRIYKTKVKNAQEAHEAIRPSGAQFASPQMVKDKLGTEAFRLYELIWKRMIACQMKDSTGTRIGVTIDCAGTTFRASGKTIEFAGFLRAYVEGSDDPEADIADRERVLPKLSVGESLGVGPVDALGHATQPPARYTEGSLIKELERLGIGRPSTWATIVDVVLSRTYAFKKGTALVPTFLASAVISLMDRYFTHLLNYEFTANLEDDLDAISRGEKDNHRYLNAFYFGNGHPGLKDLVLKGEETIDPREVCGIPIGVDSTGRKVEVRIGRYGPFLFNGETRAGLPDNLSPDELSIPAAEELLAQAAKGPESLGNHPTTGQAVYLKKGRFGPYVQLGEMVDGEDKPKMASLLAGMAPNELTLEVALKLLELPREVGKFPDNQEPIVAANGRYGPYVKCGSETRSIPGDLSNPIDITLEQAIELLRQPKARGRASSQPKTLKEVGKHPVTELTLAIKSGRYGPYVTDGKVNASLLKEQTVEELTLEQAVHLIDARAAKVGDGGGRRGKRKAAAPKAKKKAVEEDSDSESPPAKKTKAKAKSPAKPKKASGGKKKGTQPAA